MNLSKLDSFPKARLTLINGRNRIVAARNRALEQAWKANGLDYFGGYR